MPPHNRDWPSASKRNALFIVRLVLVCMDYGGRVSWEEQNTSIDGEGWWWVEERAYNGELCHDSEEYINCYATLLLDNVWGCNPINGRYKGTKWLWMESESKSIASRAGTRTSPMSLKYFPSDWLACKVIRFDPSNWYSTAFCAFICVFFFSPAN